MANTLKKEKYQVQKSRLLAQARKLFAVHGIKETSMSRIAGACKVTKATLYHYFKNKEDILKEILACRTEEINTPAGRPDASAGVEEVFYRFAKTHLEHIQKPENLELMKILLSETMKNDDLRKYYMDFVVENVSNQASQILGPYLNGKKSEKEMRLLFFQFVASLLHYDWNTRMVGDLTELIGDDEAFIRRLSRTYALAVQQS
jgi:TetR/AcrR family transcriptional regulator